MHPIPFRPLGAKSTLAGHHSNPFADFQLGATTRLREQKSFGRNPGGLRMFLYAPRLLRPNAPLVVIMHACGQSAADYDLGTGWTELADQLGFVVLAPEQTRENNLNGCFNWFLAQDTARDRGEAASIRQMMEWLIGGLKLDRARIFITGVSAGGAMTAAMLSAYPDIFAGGAIIAGLPVGPATNMGEALSSMRAPPKLPAWEWGDFVRRASSHRGPWPAVSVWHGDSDAIVHPGNAEALIAQWTNVHGLPASPARRENSGPYRRRVWQREDGTTPLEAFSVSGMGHGLPIGGPAHERYGEPGPYFLDVGLSSTTRIADFWGFPVGSVAKIVEPSRPDRQAGRRKPPQEATPGATRGVMDSILGALRSAKLVKG